MCDVVAIARVPRRRPRRAPSRARPRRGRAVVEPGEDVGVQVDHASHYDRAPATGDVRETRHVPVDRGGHRRVRDGREAVREAIELAKAVGASIELVSRVRAGLEPAAARGGAAGARRTCSGWSTRARTSTRRCARRPSGSRRAGVNVEHVRARGRPGGRDPRRRRGARRRPDRGRQQGHDRRQALPARLGAEQGLPPRALLGADHPDDLARRSTRRAGRSPRRRRAARRRRVVGAGRAERRSPSPAAGPRPPAGVGSGPSRPEAITQRGRRRARAAPPSRCR